MVKYTCEKCEKEFTQKGHYTKHINKKTIVLLKIRLKKLLKKLLLKR